MGLQAITVVLFTLFLSEALTLVCYNCNNNDASGTCTPTTDCYSSLHCGSQVTYEASAIFGNSTEMFCTNSSCVNWSVNLGWFRMTSKCCDSDRCNIASIVTDSPNGKTCFGYSDKDNTKNVTLNCKGDETQCINATVEIKQNYTVYGCATQSLCGNTANNVLNSALSPSIKIFNAKCSPANRAQGLTQGAVLLLAPTLLFLFSI